LSTCLQQCPIFWLAYIISKSAAIHYSDEYSMLCKLNICIIAIQCLGIGILRWNLNFQPLKDRNFNSTLATIPLHGSSNGLNCLQFTIAKLFHRGFLSEEPHQFILIASIHWRNKTFDCSSPEKTVSFRSRAKELNRIIYFIDRSNFPKQLLVYIEISTRQTNRVILLSS
jgi:hypothetical protein